MSIQTTMFVNSPVPTNKKITDACYTKYDHSNGFPGDAMSVFENLRNTD